MEKEYYGAKPPSKVNTWLEEKLEELRILGYTVIEDVVANEELAEIRQRLDAVYDEQKNEVQPEFTLEQIQEENQVRAPLCYDEIFVDLATTETVTSILEKVLGDYYVIHLQIGIINVPSTENRQAIWHRDLLFADYVISSPLAISVMLCIDDFNRETGGTYVVPFSHREGQMPSEEYVEKHGVTVEAKAGSVFLMDSMLIHKAGYNSSQNVRRGLNTIYTSGLLKQQISLSAMLGEKYAGDPFLNVLLGYDSNPSESVLEWRRRRHRKLYPEGK